MLKFTLVISSFLTISCLSAMAQEHLIPMPKQVRVLNSQSCTPKKVNMKVDKKSTLPAEGYVLRVTPSSVNITAKDSVGLVWAKQTLQQLSVEGKVPQVEILDYPAFPLRGFMHDTGRNFLEVETLKQHIDLMSAYKLNMFNWHLTDYPAWRIECKVYPQLNDPKFQRKGRDEGRFYTYDQIRDVIAYAHQRGIMVVPEIDMPGHSTYFNTTFGCAMDSEQGKAVLEKCLAEFFAEIPQSMCPYFHLGSDEIHISDPKGFMVWAENQMKLYNRQPLAWDPGLPTSENTIRQIWNEKTGETSAVTQNQGRYLDSFMGYLNLRDPMNFVSRNFLRRACGVEKSNDDALGGILCLWNDVNVDDKTRIPLHSGMVNGMLAYAERFWVGGSVGEVENFSVLPAPTTEPGKKLREFEKRMTYHRNHFLKDQNMRWVANASQPWKISIPSLRGVDTATVKWVDAWGGAIDMDALCATHGVKADPTMDAWAVTYLYSDRDTVIRAWVGFEAPARSNRISGGIGYQGAWENEGRLTVNGLAVQPPLDWKQPGAYKFHFHTWHRPEEEIPYTDEQFYWLREPAFVPLKKGTNKIELYTPKTFAGQPWSFAFIPVTLHNDGTVSEVTGIKF